MTKRFFRLKFGEKFEIDGDTHQKESWCSAVRSYGPAVRVYVWPWTKVSEEADAFIQLMRREERRFAARVIRSLERPSPFISLLTGGTFPKGERIEASYNGVSPFERPYSKRVTHYFGDDCSPPHGDERTGPSA